MHIVQRIHCLLQTGMEYICGIPISSSAGLAHLAGDVDRPTDMDFGFLLCQDTNIWRIQNKRQMPNNLLGWNLHYILVWESLLVLVLVLILVLVLVLVLVWWCRCWLVGWLWASSAAAGGGLSAELTECWQSSLPAAGSGGGGGSHPVHHQPIPPTQIQIQIQIQTQTRDPSTIPFNPAIAGQWSHSINQTLLKFFVSFRINFFHFNF